MNRNHDRQEAKSQNPSPIKQRFGMHKNMQVVKPLKNIDDDDSIEGEFLNRLKDESSIEYKDSYSYTSADHGDPSFYLGNK